MSIPTKEEANRFLLPLRGNVSLFVLHDIDSKVPLSRFILGCACALSLETMVLDTDAFYSANMDHLANDRSTPSGDVVLPPEQDFEVTSLLGLLSSKREMLIIDDVNSLYSLALDTRLSQQLAIMFRILSYNARMNGTWVVSTAYRTELSQGRSGTGQRLLTALGDLVIDTEFLDGTVRLNGGTAGLWPDGKYSV